MSGLLFSQNKKKKTDNSCDFLIIIIIKWTLFKPIFIFLIFWFDNFIIDIQTICEF